MPKPALRVAAGTAVAALLAVAVLAARGGQQQPPPDAPPPAQASAEQQDPEQPTFRAGVDFVRVDVIVTDKDGNPVTDLTKDDFEVVEDDTPQTVETFRFVEVDTAVPEGPNERPIRTRADEETAAADESSRIFVFFLDDYHVRLGNSMASRRPLTEFVQKQVGPNDLLAVMYPLSPLDTVTLTRDHESVVRMLERFEGRKFDYRPRNAAEERYAEQPTEVVEEIRRQVSLSALQGLSVKLGALREGRKAVILVSEGFTAVLPPQLRDANAQMPGLGNPARGNPMAGENSLAEDRAAFLGGMDVQRELEDVYAAANRSNTAIYAVDPRGLSTGEYDISENVSTTTSMDALRTTQDTLRTLAAETDGRAIVNRNDLAAGMRQIIKDSSAYYLLGYNSSLAPRDGKFHEIKVRVKRPGLQVRSRKGYWALTPEDTARVLAPPREGPPRAVVDALASLAAPRGRVVRTWLGTAPGEAGTAHVTFVWEPVAAEPGVRRDTPADVELLVASADGNLVYRGAVGGGQAAADGDGQGTGAAAPAAPGGSVTFDAPPGTFEVRMRVRGADKETLDTVTRDITVPDMTVPEPRIGTPRVHVARNALEFRRISTDAAAVPTARRTFQRTERLIVRSDVAAPGGAGTVAVTARLLNREGKFMVDLPVAHTGAPYAVDLPLSSLAPGEYLMEIAASAGEAAPATALVAFEVTG